MVCLGIESTAHTFGVGIIDSKGKVLANVRDSYTTKKGGIIPNEAAKHHKKIKDKILNDALNEAGLALNDINIISFSQGPGIAPCLLQGMRFAKELAKKLNIPLIPVNHCIAHLEIGKLLTKAKDPVLLYVSGANTQVISYASGKYRIFGETLDIGVGNFIDSFARYIGLGFPGGPRIAELAKKSNNFIELPYSVKGMDVAFSGLLTNLKQKYDKGNKIEELSFSLQEHAFAMLVEVSERAMAHLKKKELLLGGGVACNTRLQEMCKIMCKERDAKFFCPPNEFLTDNATMIAWLGILMFKAGQRCEIEKVDINPYERTDDVEVKWL
ncbi:MAG: bifunctional N(6)-L-threonylcarbamoyladenine synthase/serine/threonine protein kinase [Candidatus Pacearchaeota archaeon]|nr:MAG: bifunctional N(6)-L-threonylcarbamoyladenine synthase/serine/threonine protein kinase [Candidatus Pacearchaeota archaeon]